MRTLVTPVLFLSVFLSLKGTCYAKEWNGLVPLKSTRADVERLLGHGSDNIYRYGNQIVDVGYAQFPCGHKNPPGWPAAPPGWDVPRDTVASIRVSLGKSAVPLNSLPYDLTKLQKVRGDDDLPQHFYYSDQVDGFSIEFFDYGNDDQRVTAFLYLPTANNEKLFRCKE